MNLQVAQNLIQDAGVFFSRSEDATGARRSQLNDSNCTVVDQTPGVGAPIEEGDAVLSVVKIGEPTTADVRSHERYPKTSRTGT
ncbi:calcium-binding protein [Rhodococcoides yunnanense]|uniref:calcium-binding protein n=1 Tax=Rhodococcoides yunnanense TaxID=278209 RepID=UPI000934BA10|nr:calcium-binding protein [Rhodococcus yunnanensis]